MFYGDDDSKEEKTDYIKLKIDIRQLLKDDFNRQVLAEILLDLRKDVTGDTQQRLFDLYKNLELHKDAYRKLKSWKWHVISKGILELTQMQVEESYNLITKFVNDKRTTIRKQAEIATVSLKHEGINFFLDTTRHRISEWQQLKILDVLRNLEDFQPPRFKSWLTSSNRHVVLFALRLIKYYNQNDVKPSLIELAKHKNNQIKYEAINCIKEFNVREALDTLQTVFWKSTPHIKISILDTIAAIGDEDNVKFLQLIENKEANFSVRSKAISAINSILPESILPTQGIQDVSNYVIPDDITKKEEFEKLWPSEPELPIIEQNIDEENTNAENNAIADTVMQKENVSKIENYDETDESVPLNLQPEFEIDHSEVGVDENLEINAPDGSVEEVEPSIILSQQNNDLDDVDLQFLPIVIDAEIDEEQMEAVKNNKPIGTGDSEGHINEMEVVFDQILPQAATIEEETTENSDALNISEINFLPIVVDENDLDDKILEGPRYRYSIYEKGPKAKANDNAGVAFDQVFQQEDFQPRPLTKRVTTSKKPISIAAIDEDYAHGLTVVFDQIPYEKSGFQIKTIDNAIEALGNGHSDLEFDLPTHKVSTENNRAIHNDSSKERNKNFLKYIPEIQLYEQDTLNMLALLNDIEELGDEREIPLLLAYLDEENVPVVRERIQEILKKFSTLEMQKLKASEGKSKKGKLDEHVSVVANFFEHCDTEGKLILLDTLIDVMDQKDVRFMEELLEDPSLEIREKAQDLLYEWHERQQLIGNSNGPEKDGAHKNGTPNVSEKLDDHYDLLLDELEIQKSGSGNIFKIDFELRLDDEENHDVDVGHSTLPEKNVYGLLKLLPIKIFERLNG